VVNKFTIKGPVPTETAKEMTIEDIRVTIEDHVHAAKCAIEAGFDVVEIVLPLSPFVPFNFELIC
jgi:N-ethylmaleimide reductase